jgi:hypothetical protein
VVLLISYAANSPSDPAAKLDVLDGLIRAATTETLRPLSNMWFVETSEELAAWGSRLTPELVQDDRLVIVRVPNSASINGWLPGAQWQWFKERTY